MSKPVLAYITAILMLPVVAPSAATELLGSVSNPIAPPTDAQKLRLRELREETAKAAADLNTIVSTRVKQINDKQAGQPHIVAGAPIQ